MRRALVLLCIVSIAIIAAVPRVLNYQGKLLDSSGVEVNDTLPITFRLYSTESGGTPLWEENQTVVITNGLFSAFLGNLTPFPDSLDFSSAYWLEVEINDEILNPREKLVSVPYALRSEYTNRALQSVYSDSNTTRRTGDLVFRAGPGAALSDDGSTITITIGGASSTTPDLYEVLRAGNDAGSRQIKNLGEPTEAQDAATKNYVDSGVRSITPGTALAANASMGNVTLNVQVDNNTIEANPSNQLQVKPGSITGEHIMDGSITIEDISPGTILEGSGSENYIAKFTGTSTLGNSAIYEADGNMGIGTTSPTARLYVKTTDTTTVPFWVEALTGSSLSGWSYRKPITINNTSNSNTLTDYQVLITFDTQSLISAGKMRLDCGDIRFTDFDGASSLNYWIESGCNTASTKVWVKVPSIPASSTKRIYVYYGNSSATSQSNGDATFDLFDDFPGTSLNTDKWVLIGDYSISSGIITLNPNHISNDGTIDGISRPDGIYSTSTFNYPMEIRTKIAGHTSYARYTIGVIGLYYNYDDGGSTWWGLILNQSRVVTWGYDVPSNGLVGDVLVRITSSSFYLKDPSANTPQTWAYGLNNNPNNYRIVISSWADSDTRIDFVTVRKYTSPEPTTSIGTEETPPPLAQTTVFYIKNRTGNIGIGTNNPGSYKLYVNGTAYSTGGWQLSDIRYKNNILPLTNALEKLSQIRPVSFEWKINEYPQKGFPDGRHYGVIAQEVEHILPEVVIEGPDGEKAVSYNELVPILIEAIIEQQHQIEELKATIQNKK